MLFARARLGESATAGSYHGLEGAYLHGRAGHAALKANGAVEGERLPFGLAPEGGESSESLDLEVVVAAGLVRGLPGSGRARCGGLGRSDPAELL